MEESFGLENHSTGRLGRNLAEQLEATYLKDDLLQRVRGHVEREQAEYEVVLAHTKFVQVAGVNTAVLGAVADRREAHQVLLALYSGLEDRGFLANDYERQHFAQTIQEYETLVWDKSNFGSPLTPALVGKKYSEKVGKPENEPLQKFGMAHFVERMRTEFQKLYVVPHGIRLNQVNS